MDVGFGVLDVDFGVGHVQIAAEDHGLFLFQPLQIGQKSVLPLHAVGQAGQTVLGIGGVHGDEKEVRELQGDHPALMVKFVDADAIPHGQRLLPGEYRRAGIALLFGVIPVLMIARQLQRDLPGLQLGFLEAENVRVQGVERVLKSLAHHGPQAVHIP